jgi:hypothetical protein
LTSQRHKTLIHDVSLFQEIIALQGIVEGMDRITKDERNLPASSGLSSIAEDFQGSGSQLNNQTSDRRRGGVTATSPAELIKTGGDLLDVRLRQSIADITATSAR